MSVWTTTRGFHTVPLSGGVAARRSSAEVARCESPRRRFAWAESESRCPHGLSAARARLLPLTDLCLLAKNRSHQHTGAEVLACPAACVTTGGRVIQKAALSAAARAHWNPLSGRHEPLRATRAEPSAAHLTTQLCVESCRDAPIIGIAAIEDLEAQQIWSETRAPTNSQISAHKCVPRIHRYLENTCISCSMLNSNYIQRVQLVQYCTMTLCTFSLSFHVSSLEYSQNLFCRFKVFIKIPRMKMFLCFNSRISKLTV